MEMVKKKVEALESFEQILSDELDYR